MILSLYNLTYNPKRIQPEQSGHEKWQALKTIKKEGNRMEQNETALEVEKKPEARNVLDVIARYTRQEQEVALAFLRGAQYGQAIQPRPG